MKVKLEKCKVKGIKGFFYKWRFLGVGTCHKIYVMKKQEIFDNRWENNVARFLIIEKKKNFWCLKEFFRFFKRFSIIEVKKNLTGFWSSEWKRVFKRFVVIVEVKKNFGTFLMIEVNKNWGIPDNGREKNSRYFWESKKK